MNMIELKDVSVQFDIIHKKRGTLKESFIAMAKRERDIRETIWALKNVSFNVEPGECLGVVGENASGKTTLLKVIGGILKPTSGEVTVRGRLAPLLTLGVGFNPELTGRENVYFYASLMGLTKEEIDRRYEGIVDFSGLSHFMNTKLKNFSEGMKMRIGFATAISVDADILLMDEILTVGDGAFQQKCLEKFEDLKKQGKTIIFVSHGLSPVRQYCDRAIFLHHGEIREIGLTEQVVKIYERYLMNKQLKEYNSNFVRMMHEIGRESTVEDVKLFNKDEEECYLFRAGEPLKATIRFKPGRDSDIFMTFHSEKGEVGIYGKNLKAGVAEFSIDALPLPAGSYVFSIGPATSLNSLRMVVEEGDGSKGVRLFLHSLPASTKFLNKEILAFGDGCERVVEDFEGGKAVVVFSSIEDAKTNCKHGALLDMGRVLFSGDVEEVFKLYEKRVYEETVEKYGKILGRFLDKEKSTPLSFLENKG